jgi:hypothetical protein
MEIELNKVTYDHNYSGEKVFNYTAYSGDRVIYTGKSIQEANLECKRRWLKSTYICREPVYIHEGLGLDYAVDYWKYKDSLIKEVLT